MVKHHGVPSLEKKKEIIYENITKKDEILSILGPPSTTSKFDNDLWIYIERKQTQSKLSRLGKMKISRNDILILEIDDYGILKKKDFYNKENMEEIRILSATTESGFRKKSFIYDFLSSMRQKMDDPLGQRAKRRKEIRKR